MFSHRVVVLELCTDLIDYNNHWGYSSATFKRGLCLFTGDDQKAHQCAAAYISDSFLIGTALMPDSDGTLGRKFFLTSIDHSVWFHSEFRADEWMLYEMESSFTGEFTFFQSNYNKNFFLVYDKG